MLGCRLELYLLMIACSIMRHAIHGDHSRLHLRARGKQAQERACDKPASLGMRSAQLLLRVQVGTISDVRFQNVTCTAEAGIVVAGSVDATIEGSRAGECGH